MNTLNKTEEEKMREDFHNCELDFESDHDRRPGVFEIWQLAIAHANSKHSAILEDYDRLAKLCEKQAEEIANLKAKEQVLYDMHAALGVKWGEDPYAAVNAMRHRISDARELIQEVRKLLNGSDASWKWVQLRLEGDLQGGCWSFPDRCDAWLDTIDRASANRKGE